MLKFVSLSPTCSFNDKQPLPWVQPASKWQQAGDRDNADARTVPSEPDTNPLSAGESSYKKCSHSCAGLYFTRRSLETRFRELAGRLWRKMDSKSYYVYLNYFYVRASSTWGYTANVVPILQLRVSIPHLLECNKNLTWRTFCIHYFNWVGTSKKMPEDHKNLRIFRQTYDS